MATANGMPELEIVFKGLGTTAIQRGERGTAVLIVDDNTVDESYAKYKSVSDFTTTEQAKYTLDNIAAIKDALEGIPRELIVFRIGEGKVLTDILKDIAGCIPRNSWIAVNVNENGEQNEIVTWIKSENKNSKKRYKAIVFSVFAADDKHIVNLTTEKVVFSDVRGESGGLNAIPYLLGFLAGLPLSMSAIAKPLGKFSSVTEPEDLNESISNGEFVLFNDEGIVKVARGVNSMVTLGQDDIIEMTHINTVEKMDLIFTDIYNAWNNSFKGRYPNILDNQMILISAINGYYKSLALDYILDPEFENKATVDIEKQRIANYPKYGQETVDEWTDSKVLKMTVGTDVFLKNSIKISGIMESFYLDIYM